jgi:hypothetical protein
MWPAIDGVGGHSGDEQQVVGHSDDEQDAGYRGEERLAPARTVDAKQQDGTRRETHSRQQEEEHGMRPELHTMLHHFHPQKPRDLDDLRTRHVPHVCNPQNSERRCHEVGDGSDLSGTLHPRVVQQKLQVDRNRENQANCGQQRS